MGSRGTFMDVDSSAREILLLNIVLFYQHGDDLRRQFPHCSYFRKSPQSRQLTNCVSPTFMLKSPR
jgi:hypothetical protein